MRFNKEKPHINAQSKAIINNFNSWKPLYKRSKQVLAMAKHKIDVLRTIEDEEKSKQEEKEWEEIQQNHVHKHTQNKKVNKYDWERYYNGRFVKHLKDREHRVQELDKRWNKPNQAVPVVNKSSIRTVSVGAVVRVQDRVANDLVNRKMKLKKLERDLTPSFRPRINSKTNSILERSMKKSNKYRTNDASLKYNSVDKVSNFIQNYSYDNRNIKEFLNEFHKNDSKRFETEQSKAKENYNTVGHTDGTFDSFNFASRPKQDDFKTFLDNYEKNVSNAIQIEEELNTDLLKGETDEEEHILQPENPHLDSLSFHQISEAQEQNETEPMADHGSEDGSNHRKDGEECSKLEMQTKQYHSTKSAGMRQIEYLYEEGNTISSGKEHPIIEEVEQDHGSSKESESKALSKQDQELLKRLDLGSAQTVSLNLMQLYDQLQSKLSKQESNQSERSIQEEPKDPGKESTS